MGTRVADLENMYGEEAESNSIKFWHNQYANAKLLCANTFLSMAELRNIKYF
jgi:hypothetical protein